MKIKNVVVAVSILVSVPNLVSCTFNAAPVAATTPASEKWDAIAMTGVTPGTVMVSVSTEDSSVSTVRISLGGRAKDIPVGGAAPFTGLPQETFQVRGTALDKEGRVLSSKDLGTVVVSKGATSTVSGTLDASDLTVSGKLDGNIPVIQYTAKEAARLRVYYGSSSEPPLVKSIDVIQGSSEYRGSALSGTGYWKVELLDLSSGNVVTSQSGIIANATTSTNTDALSISSLQASSITDSSVRLYAFADGAAKIRFEIDGRVYSVDGETYDLIVPDLDEDRSYTVLAKAYRSDGTFVERSTGFRTEKTSSSNNDNNNNNDSNTSLGNNQASSKLSVNTQDAGISAIEVRREGSTNKYRLILKFASSWNGRSLVLSANGGSKTVTVENGEAFWGFVTSPNPYAYTIKYNGQTVSSGSLNLG